MTVPVPGRQKTLTKPSVIACILARGLRASGSFTLTAWTEPSSTIRWVQPTVAISGSVNTVLETTPRSSGETASPRAWRIAIRPCIAATEASISTPVTSPAAYTPGAVVRETRSTRMHPWSSSCTPAVSSPSPSTLGTEPTAISACDPSTVRPSVRVTTTPSSVRRAAAARERASTVMPLRRKTPSITSAASASSPGSTRSREDTRTTSLPRDS